MKLDLHVIGHIRVTREMEKYKKTIASKRHIIEA